MKLYLPNATQDGPAITLPESGNGTNSTVQPYQVTLVGNTGPQKINLPITVESSTQGTTSGTRRVLVKVSTQYASSTNVATATNSTANLMGEMSAHIVLTVPAQFCKDISGGSTAFAQATDQLLPLMAMLESLLGPRGNTAAFKQWFTAETNDSTAAVTVGGVSGDVKVTNSTKAYTADHPLIRGALGFRPLADLEYGKLVRNS